MHFHALGDRAVRNGLDAIEAARQPNSQRQRHHLAHLQVMHPDDIRRFAELNATANIQALWAAHEPQMDELTIPFLGERRSGWQYPFRSLQDAGANLCAGSDWPVSSPDPLWAAHVAVNRIAPPAADRAAHDDPGAFLPEQRLDLSTFLAAYTCGSARINGVEASAGAIRPGLDADFAVVDADLANISSHEIGRARSPRPGSAANSSTSRATSARATTTADNQTAPALQRGRSTASRRTDEPTTANVSGCGHAGSLRAPRRGVRPVGRRQQLEHDLVSPTTGPGNDHRDRHEAGLVGHLGGVPAGELARPDLRL